MSDQRADAASSPVPDPLRRPANVPRSSTTITGQSVIGKTISIKGEIAGAESVLIEGHFEGTITLPHDRVTVGATGRVSATIAAQDIVIQGEVTGACTATDHLYVRRDGSLCGDVVTSRVSIEEGAHLTGSIDIRKESKPAALKLEQHADSATEQELVGSVN